MRLHSLKSKLLLAVAALVIGSGLLISLLFTQRYRSSVYESMAVQAENQAHAIALDATDQILTNDRVALQKMLDYQIRRSPDIAYLFIVRHDQVLAHTFARGIPRDLMGANSVSEGRMFHLKRIESTTGEGYLDVAFSIFDGKAGVLRLGMSTLPYQSQVTHLMVQMGALTVAILLLGILLALWLIKKMTRPLSELARAAQGIDQDRGEFDADLKESYGEIGELTSAFQQMVRRIKHSTLRLQQQNIELERTQRQTRNFCEIVQQIGSQRKLVDIGNLLIARFKEILKCSQIAMLIFNDAHDVLYSFAGGGFQSHRDVATLRAVEKAAAGAKQKIEDGGAFPFRHPLVPVEFQQASKQAIIPFYTDQQLNGALVAACLDAGTCNSAELDVVHLILTQSAGVIRRAICHEEEMQRLRHHFSAAQGYGGIIGKDGKMQAIYGLIEDIAPTDATVLIQGESGTGKELVAQAIHQKSNRCNEPFIVINCATFPDTLLESEIFGHEKGAFTGAIRQKTGRFEQADGGTVFLDEVGEIPLSAQTKLLRVLQTKKFERIGGENTLTVDVRILAATHKNLTDEVKAGNFREDLFYRLNVIPIQLPPLRDRRNDISLLADHFLKFFSRQNGKKISEISSEALRLLLNYSWPGNVRELENSIEHAVLLAKNCKIEASDLPTLILGSGSTDRQDRIPTLAENEKEFLELIMEKCGWNKRKAARNLAISRNTLYLKLKKYQIEAQSFNN